MGYLIDAIKKPYLLFTIQNGDLLSWDITTTIDLKGTENFIVDQCTIAYVNATTPLVFFGTPEIKLIDSLGNSILYAFGGAGYNITQDHAVRLSGGNKSSNTVVPYEYVTGLFLQNTESIVSGDGDLLIYLWGTFL